MTDASIGLLGLAEQRLKYLGARQGVLAANIANADTPGWKARDLKPFAQMLTSASLAGGSLVHTNAAHLAGTVQDQTATKTLHGETAPDGNQVSLDQQLEKIAQTDSDHEAVTAIYRRYVAMFKAALGR
jgi:flagellar basal-body rod protein FlgB